MSRGRRAHGRVHRSRVHVGARRLDRGFETFASGSAADAIRWLEQHRAEPFFVFFHTYLVHAPYRDHRFVAGLPGGRLEPYVQDEKRRELLHLRLTGGRFVSTPEERAYLLALYDGGVARADEEVAAIWAALERLGLTTSSTPGAPPTTGARCTTSCCACRSSGTSPGSRTLAARSTRRRA